MAVKKKPTPPQWTPQQEWQIHRVLNAGRRRLLAYVYEQAGEIGQRDRKVANQIVLIAELLHGFGKPRWRRTAKDLAAIPKSTDIAADALHAMYRRIEKADK